MFAAWNVPPPARAPLVNVRLLLKVTPGATTMPPSAALSVTAPEPREALLPSATTQAPSMVVPPVKPAAFAM